MSKDDVEIYGIVPDGVASVWVELADGSREKLSVSDNAYAARFSQATKRVEFEDANGETMNLSAESFSG
jgi:hypothetical protein